MTLRIRYPLLAGALLACLAVSATAQPLDPADRDTATPACTDFYQHANGGWLAANPVPAGRGSFGRFDQLKQTSLQQQRELLDAMDPASSDATEQMLALFWRTGLDEATVEAQGITPLAPLLASIDGIRRPRDVADTLASLHAQGLPLAFNFGADIDLGDFGRTIAYATQGGLGLPDPAYYLREDAETRALLARYRGHVEAVLAQLGVPAAELATQSSWVVGMEMRLAGASLSLIELRDPYHSYKVQPLRELDRRYPNLRLREFARAQGLRDLDSVSLAHERFFQALNGLVGSVPLEEWQAYLRFHTANTMAPHLSQALRGAHFEMYGRLLAGEAEPAPRWLQVLDTMDTAVGDAIGQAYVARHLDDAERERAEAVVEGVRAQLAEGLAEATWLGTEAKAAAAEKLGTLRVEVGVPRHWADFDGLELGGNSHASHVLAAAAHRHRQELSRIGQTTELRWPVPTQLPDIGYDLALNRLTVTAALLQPPVLSSDGDAAVDFGALGTLAAQQLTHAFDDKGRTIDGSGRFNNWWSEADRNGFAQRVEPLQGQYDNFNAIDGIRVSGRVTRDGNVADLSGVELAYRALEASGDAGDVDGSSAAQRFFLSNARMWQRNYRPEELKLRLASETQAPAKFRVNGPLMHQAAFAEAFSCEAGSPMVQPEAQRVVLWR